MKQHLFILLLAASAVAANDPTETQTIYSISHCIPTNIGHDSQQDKSTKHDIPVSSPAVLKLFFSGSETLTRSPYTLADNEQHS